jgi:hypothetical protein
LLSSRAFHSQKVLGNGSRRHGDLCCSAEFVSANCPQQEIAGPG